MAGVFDIETAALSAVWNALMANDDWKAVVDPGNRLSSISPEGTQKQFKYSTSEGDYPEVYMRCTGGSGEFYTSDVTFATHSEEGHPHWQDKSIVRIRISVTAQLNSQGEVNRAGALTRNALRLAGVRLGQSWIEQWTMSWESRREELSADDDDSDTVIRERQIIELTISTLHDGPALQI